jgi:uncharacterized delta-60 repeat protein
MTATSLFRLLDTGAPDPSFTATSNAKVHSIIVEPDGKITIGGEFQLWNDTARERLARLNSDGSLDGTFVNNTPFPYPVRTLAKLKDGKLMVGGSSASFTDTNPSRLTRHNSNGTLDTSFTTKVKIPSSAEMVRVQPDGKIIVGGTFWYVNGSERKYIARLHTSGTLDTSFAAEPDGAVLAVAFQSDGKILVGGRFATVNGVNRSRIARLNADGSLDTSFDPGAGIGGGFPTSASVHAIVPLADGKFLLGGSFLTYNDTSRRGIVRINANGSLDTSFDSGGVTGGSEIVSNVIPQPDGKILIGGNFVFIGGVRRIGIARLGVNGALDTSFSSDPGLNNSVHAAALQPDGKVLIGGIFDVVHGATRNNFARLTSDGFRDDTLNVGTGFSGGAGFSYVTAIDLQSDGKILVAGNFTFYNGTSANYLIRLNTDGSVDPGFDIGAGPNLRINSLARLANGDVVIAGLFTYVQGYFHSAIARIKMGGRSAPFDFDGDGKTDVGIFRPSAAEWWIYRSGSGSVFAAQFGATTDKIVPADFTGDGKTDVAFWRPSTGEWFVVRSEDGTYFAAPFGAASDIPVPADYDGDGKADVAVFRPSDGNWYIRRSSDGVTTAQLFGQNGDQPIPADYDGDGKTDVAIYRPSVSEWWIYRSTAGVIAYSFGTATDKTVPADYTGDGKADVAFWRPSTGEWVILRSEDTTYYSAPFGASSDLPTTGDYDGDGKVDLAVFRPSNGTWFVNRTSGGTSAQQFGANGDQPLSGAFVR